MTSGSRLDTEDDGDPPIGRIPKRGFLTDEKVAAFASAEVLGLRAGRKYSEVP